MIDKDIIIATIGATAVVTSAIVTGIFKLLELRKRKREEENKKMPITQISLFEKDLFSKSEYWVNYTIKRFGFENGERAWIYETIMGTIIKEFAEQSKDFIEDNDLTLINKSRYENLIFTLISNIIYQYNLKIKEAFVKKFGKNKGEKIFNLVMDKQSTKENPSIGFNIWYAQTITYLEKSTKDHCEAYYPNSVERMDMILDEFRSALGAAHTNLYKMFANFNGELDSLIYS